MTPLDQLIRDARTALETIELASKRNEGQQHAISSTEWLERIARDMREELGNEKSPDAGATE